jgi:hypothetical protein
MKRTTRKGILALGGMLLMSSAALGQHKFDHVQYLKPWTKGQKQGSYPVKGSLVFDRDRKAVEFLDEKNNAVISFPNENITSISVARKDASWLLNPIVVWVPKCFLTFRYKDTEGAEQSAVLIILENKSTRELLMATAAETGKEVFHREDPPGNRCG